jgi:predicted RecA/RadA family phage recombinase
MKNYVQGDENIKVTAPRAVNAGDGVLVGNLFGLAIDTAANGADVVLCTEGVFDITALSTDTGTVGTKVYWDDTNHYVTVTATSNHFIGVLTAAKANGNATARVRLSDPSA